MTTRTNTIHERNGILIINFPNNIREMSAQQVDCAENIFLVPHGTFICFYLIIIAHLIQVHVRVFFISVPFFFPFSGKIMTCSSVASSEFNVNKTSYVSHFDERSCVCLNILKCPIFVTSSVN